MSRLPFVHLHVHSHYSLLQALPQIDQLVKTAKKDGQTALALTDAGSMYGVIDFYKECQKAGIKPIIGVDAYVAPRTRFDKEHRIDNRTARLVLLCQNEIGYRNLIQIVTKSNLEGFYYNPRVDHDLLATYKEGIIAILPSFGSEVSRALDEEDTAKAAQSLDWYKKTFGDALYMEITRHPEIDRHDDKMQVLVAMAQKNNVPLVAAQDTYYMKREEALARELVIKIKSGGHLDRDSEIVEDFSFKTQDQIHEMFAEYPEAIANTAKVAERCNLTLVLGTWVFPNFEVPEGTTHDSELRKLAYKGFELRGLPQTPEIIERLDYELGVIAAKGYSPYFLVVSDLLQYARKAGIFTNTRGSAAGSLASYMSGITTVDPLEFQLPFERFLNPERPSPPDIDMDIADNRRDELIDYARSKYGDDHVAQIGTFGTMMARAAVRDVSRALGFSYGVGDRIAKLIPFGKQGFPVTIDSALKEVTELKDAYDQDSEVRSVIDLAQIIEGNARHIGVHAAGVVLSPTPVTDFVPLQQDPKGGKTITQYDMHAVEDAGLLKFDFLGLTNLSILADAVFRVQNRLGASVDIDKLPKGDEKTFAMLSRGETLGVFQMASDGMTSYLVQLKPTRVDDLNVMVALYRPGPMDNITEYMARKNGEKKITYLHPKMESYLAKTFGVLVYQDDLLMTAIELAGYSWGEVDKFRKAVGKKIPEEMAKQHVIFVNGCKTHTGMSAKDAEALWTLFEPFQGYGFNKAHAASYGNLAYQTAYMKANFPVDYMAALLTADSGDVEKIGAIVAEAKRMGIAVLPPDINESDNTFTVINELTIRFGLTSVKNFGEGIGITIMTERKEKGRFASLADLLSRVTDKNLNKKSLESLIQCGALDALGERGQLTQNIELLLAYHKEGSHAAKDQGSLFSMGGAPTGPIPLNLPSAPAATQKQKLTWEKELLGLYISGHPLDAFKDKLSKQKLDLAGTKATLKDGTQTVVAGCVETVSHKITKKGDKMAFLTIVDMKDKMEIVIFPKILKDNIAFFDPGRCLLIKGTVSARNGEQSFVADAVMAL